MLSEYQIFAISQLRWPLSAPIATSLGYLAAAPVSRARARLLMAAPGLVVILAVVFAVGLASWTNSHSVLGWIVFLSFTGLLVFALAADIAALYAVGRPTIIDALQFLLLPSIPFIWFAGMMVIGHEWL